MQNKRKYYRQRATYMRKVAAEAETNALRDSCLQAAVESERMADAEPADQEEKED